MRISDWSSDVCSSDLLAHGGQDAPEGIWDRIVGSLEEAPPALRLAPMAIPDPTADGTTSTGVNPLSASRRAPRRVVAALAAAAAVAIVAVLGEAADGAGRILVEVFEVGAEVEDEELALVLHRAEKIRAQARAAPDHLQELHLRANRLEEHQVDDLRHVEDRKSVV